eukprot:1160091_1
MSQITTIGDRVKLRDSNLVGIVRFIGEIKKKADIYYGIELDEAKGKNDGSISRIHYFRCASKHGLFIQQSQILKTNSKYNPDVPRATVGDTVYIKKFNCNAVVRYIGSPEFRSKATKMSRSKSITAYSKEQITSASRSKALSKCPDVTCTSPSSKRSKFAEFALCNIWYGVELPFAKGKNNGTVQKKWYFECDAKHGSFVRKEQIKLIENEVEHDEEEKELETTSTPKGSDRPNSARNRLMNAWNWNRNNKENIDNNVVDIHVPHGTKGTNARLKRPHMRERSRSLDLYNISTAIATTNDKKKKKKKATEQVEMKQEESIAIEKSTNCSTNNDLLCDDDQSSLSSSSSNVEQFLDSLKNDNSKKRKNDNKTKEPPSKKRRLNTEDCDDGDLSDEFEYDLLREVDEKTIECYSKELEEIRADTLRSFGLSCIAREPFIFRKSIDLDAMYPHRVYNKLLKYEECTADLTASQLLGLYAENMATMRMYKAYINLPSVVPITLPVIDGKCVSLRMLQRPFVIENWWDLHCKFPSGCSYLDLLVNIGGSTEIRVMDNITNCAISEDMKLYQYLYLLSGTKPEEREYSMNLISLEISGSILDRYIVRPRFIQNMDWISPKRHCWFKSNKFRKYFFSTTNNLRGIVDNVENKNLFYIEDGIKTMGGEEEEEEVDELEALKHSILSSKVTHSGFPEIQKYVLICSANSFTEWHTDFNGSCVWYYVVRGIKYFYIMTPTTPGILEEYRKWREQSEIRWFPEYAKCSAQLVIVAANELLVLPSGTIHCVYTPVDCVAFSGNWLCDDNIQKQLRIEHLHHEIHSPAHVPCCHYFRDLNALRVCEFYYEMKKNHKLKAKKDKQNAMDLCIQMLFWIKEEEEQQKKKTNDERLCKFDLIDIDKLKPKVVQTLAMLGCKTTLNIGNQMKRFVAKYPHYRAPKNALEGEEEEEESDSSSSSIISTNDDEESDYDIVEDDTQYDADTSEEDEQMIARKKTLRSATSTAANKKRIKKKKKKKKTTKKKKKKKSDKIECFKCAEQSPR